MAADVSSSPIALSWQPRRRAPRPMQSITRYSRDQLLALAPRASFPNAILRAAPEVLAVAPAAAESSASPSPASPIYPTTPITAIFNCSSPLLRSSYTSPASPSSPLSVSTPSSAPKQRKMETDEHRLSQRAKQIEYGKRTSGYQNYIAQVPRKRRGATDPRTPDVTQKCSKRSWDGQVRKWRRLLHAFDDTASDSSGPEPCGSVDSIESADESSDNDIAEASCSDAAALPIVSHLEQLSLSVQVAAN